MSVEQDKSAGRSPGLLKIRGFILLGFMALLVPCGVLASQLKTDNAIERWLGESNTAVQRWDEFRRRFQLNNEIIVLLDGVTEDDQRIASAASRLERTNIVERVRTSADVQASDRSSMSEQLKQLLGPRDAAVLWIELKENAGEDAVHTNQLIGSLLVKAELPADSIHMGGPLVVNAALDLWSRNSLQKLMPFVVYLSFSLLWFFRESLFQAVLLSFSAGISVLLTFALMSAFDVRLNMLLVVLPPLIGVLHLSIAIHLVHHFDRLAPRCHGDDRVSVHWAVHQAIRETLVPSSLATLTTVIGMASLAVSELGPVRMFGIWSSVGLLVSFAVAYLLLPCFLSETPPKYLPGLRGSWISHRFLWRKRIVLFVSVISIACVIPGWFRLAPDFNAIEFLPADSRLRTDYRIIEDRCCALVPVELDVDVSQVSDSGERFRLLQRLLARIEDHPEVTIALSAASFMTLSDVPPELVKQWISADHHLRVSALVRSDSAKSLQDIVDDIRVLCDDEPVTTTGLVALIDESQRRIFRSLTDSLAVALVLVTVVLSIVLKSVPAGLTALLPNVFPIVLGFGAIGWLDMSLDVGTVLTASIALGVALDDSLHFIHQFRQFDRRSPGDGANIRRTWEACASPMIQTTVVASTGLFFLGVSDFRPVAYFGTLMGLLLSLALVADLIILPFLLTTNVASGFVIGTPDLRPGGEPEADSVRLANAARM